MKKLFLLMMTFFMSVMAVSAQDLITKKSGEDIEAKVLEIDDSNIKYRLASEPDGVTYTISKSDVLMIRYASGRNEVFNETVTGPYHSGRMPVDGIVPGMKYKQLKKIYNYKDYIPGTVEKHRKPGGCGVASFFIPGLGQLIEGEVGRGLGWFGGAVLSSVLFTVGLQELSYIVEYDEMDDVYDLGEFGPQHLAVILGAVGSITIPIWSTVDAVRIAKVQNLYYSDLKQQKKYSIELHPSVDYMRTASGVQPTAGLALSLKF